MTFVALVFEKHTVNEFILQTGRFIHYSVYSMLQLWTPRHQALLFLFFLENFWCQITFSRMYTVIWIITREMYTFTCWLSHLDFFFFLIFTNDSFILHFKNHTIYSFLFIISSFFSKEIFFSHILYTRISCFCICFFSPLFSFDFYNTILYRCIQFLFLNYIFLTNDHYFQEVTSDFCPQTW